MANVSTRSLFLFAHFIYFVVGKIACSNVLSDLYALGVTDCDNMLMILGVSIKMTEKERDVVVPLIMKGFRVSFLSLFMSRYNPVCKIFNELMLCRIVLLKPELS